MLKKVILVFKTHIDIGFTDLAESVMEEYAGPMLRRVIQTCRATEHLGKLRYVWTLPAWPLWYMTKHCAPELKPELERLIENGQIVWHALPFTSHTDFCAPEEYVQGLQYARLLSERYGKPIPVAGKMTDVPGHGLMLPELLDQAGVRFLHIGCNEFAMPPQVPMLFSWRSPAGGQLLTMYNKGGYGSSILPPEGWHFPVWLALMHTHDNCGPQSAEIITKLAEEVRAAYPQAEIVCGTLDDFYRELIKCDLSRVPVIKTDLADTWIHGIASYPAEVSQVRENREQARRLHQSYYTHLVRGGGAIPGLENLWERYYEQICLFEEHTWGADVKRRLGPDRVYDKPAFLAARSTEPYRFMERSWEEQRGRAKQSGELLCKIAEKVPLPPPEERQIGKLRIGRSNGQTVAENQRYRMRFDGRSGSIEELYDKKLEAPLLKSQEGTGVFSYQYDRYGIEDITEFLRSYAHHFTTWGIQDYGRENYPDCAHKSFRPVFERYEVQDDKVIFYYSTRESAQRYGDCRRLTLTVRLPSDRDVFEVELALEEKQATPYVESGSLIFPLAGKSAYRLGKPCAVVDPETQIVSCANHALMNVEHEVTAIGEDVCLTVCPKDTPLLSIGTPGIYEYQKEFQQGRKPQLWFNVFNNMWGTNFPQWIEGSFRYRYVLWGSTRSEAEQSPARAASVFQGPQRVSPPGIPESLELVCTRLEGGTLYIILRDYSGEAAMRTLQVPGARIAPADLLYRISGDYHRDELTFQVRPYGLNCFALKL